MCNCHEMLDLPPKKSCCKMIYRWRKIYLNYITWYVLEIMYTYTVTKEIQYDKLGKVYHHRAQKLFPPWTRLERRRREGAGRNRRKEGKRTEERSGRKRSDSFSHSSSSRTGSSSQETKGKRSGFPLRKIREREWS